MENDNELYEVAIKNVPFKQAQGIYRFLVDLYDAEEMYGNPGVSWSGLIDGKRKDQDSRTVVLTPMEQIKEEALALRAYYHPEIRS